MPRTARIVLPNYPHHIIQRGHNRQTVFATEDDCLYYLDNLAEFKQAFNCKVYAFCLMTNHSHLVSDPCDQPDKLGKLMKRLAGRQTRYVNRIEGRTGTLWEGRFRSSPIDSDEYLLACCRYVEMNPVMAGMCGDAAGYKWSSCSTRLARDGCKWLDFDSLYLGLGKTQQERGEKYAEFLSGAIIEEEKLIILGAVQRGQLTGGGAFVDEIEQKLARRVEFRGQGRPRKAGK